MGQGWGEGGEGCVRVRVLELNSVTKIKVTEELARKLKRSMTLLMIRMVEG